MKTAAEYRAMADECLKWAREARADELRVSSLQLAQVWLDARLDHPDKVSARRTKQNRAFGRLDRRPQWAFAARQKNVDS
jgi:hypothetical protein